jgi:hypothetical protein
MNTRRLTANGLTVSEHLAHVFTHLEGERDLELLVFLDDLSASLDNYTCTHRTDAAVGKLYGAIREARGIINRELNAAGLNEQA